ncbi:nucleotidyltransferase domain-containing protein [Candidatus Hakubella thermalkaliphila]|uniref:nucleotidyltransferase domain-containing protein n=1 Tax=Candidatus Hakubella thermalkaliphila TaxID=2754717 RepID=UPI001594AA46|nr:nucleotidyltransferase domain-containing protein [Candidatus Hakubella thermalkaliphila]
MNKVKQTSSNARNLEKLSLLKTEERNAVLEFADLLRERFGFLIKELILFGSKARGESDQESDIDILIVLTNLSWEIKKSISELAAEENLKHNVLISTIRYDAATWESPLIKASPFGKSIREEGIWL